MLRRRVLVTGAVGFIGSHVTELLLRQGDIVVGLDNLDPYYCPDRKQGNLAEVKRSPSADRFTFVQGDVRDSGLLKRLFRRHSFDTIIHLAAMPGVRASVDAPGLYYDVNLNGTLQLLERVREAGADTARRSPHFVFASTSSAYGRTDQLPFHESDTADRPLAPYPASKRSAEMLGHAYYNMHGIDFTALRFFTVYGARGRPDMMAYKVLDSIRTGKQIPLYRGGDMWRDWTAVTDIAEGVALASRRRLGYRILNLGRGEAVRLSSFIEELERLAGKRANLVARPMPAADVVRTFADISAARELIGYSPKLEVTAGAEKMFEWYCSCIGDPRPRPRHHAQHLAPTLRHQALVSQR